MRGIYIAAGLLVLSGCGLSGDTGRSFFEWIVKYVTIGSSNDVWLVKNSFGFEDRVGLIFGYADDMAGCRDIADALNQKFPAAKYYCKYVN